jgi:hypothetical protein
MQISTAIAAPVQAPIGCPDCGGWLKLQPKPEAWRGASRWVFLCENRPLCRGLLSTHPDGSPVGEAVTQAIRDARKHCHVVLDRLWLTAETLYEIRERGSQRTKVIARIRRTARNRAYHYLAAQLGMAEEACHVGKITDVELLRRFYAAARKAEPAAIRAWAKERGL